MFGYAPGPPILFVYGPGAGGMPAMFVRSGFWGPSGGWVCPSGGGLCPPSGGGPTALGGGINGGCFCCILV